MNLKSGAYFPVLRLKRGELWALRYLAPDARELITPIIEILPKNLAASRSNPEGDLDACADLIGEDLWTAWGGRRSVLDTQHIGEINRESRTLARLAAYAVANGLVLAPVIRLSAPTAMIASVRAFMSVVKNGCCIRLCRGDVDAEGTANAVCDLLTLLEVAPDNVDLVVDLGISTGFPPFDYIKDRVPRLPEWRSFTILSGAFPKDLQRADLKDPGVHRITRTDWRHWASEVTRDGTSRVPSFGDYTVQYAAYVEPPSNSNPSASIRYTSDSEWVLMRGQGIRNEDSAGNKQWPANALLLCDMPEFCGAEFSFGDRYIAEHAGAYEKPGSPNTWIRAAINHHLVFAARQIGNLLSQARSVETVEASIDRGR